MILVTGANGQLGQQFAKLWGPETALFCDIDTLDITQPGQVLEYCKTNQIKTIINCAAYTAVDKAESEPEKAFHVNKTGPQVLADTSKKLDIFLIHFSTDYVFSGNHQSPYTEEDSPDPQSVYGKSKLEGEKAILDSQCNSAIFRISWLYSAHGQNFVKTMIRLAQERNSLSIVNDQIGNPTYTGTVVECVDRNFKNIVSLKGFNLFHLSDEGSISWYDFAKQIFEETHLSIELKPISTLEYPTPAKRPSYSVFNLSKINNTFSYTPKNWKEGLNLCLKEMS
ncbi:MAG: dTDP-4-dehydrorhamnose reductase [Bdellovibrionales bacterium]|nr:dTDP-4-dehydrorhamnose reductase [Bdellovibrionales bacterium]